MHPKVRTAENSIEQKNKREKAHLGERHGVLLLLQGLGGLGVLGRQLLAVAAPGRVELHQDVVVGLLVPQKTHAKIKAENESNPGGKAREKPHNPRETDRDDSVEVVAGEHEHSVLLLDLLEPAASDLGFKGEFCDGEKGGTHVRGGREGEEQSEDRECEAGGLDHRFERTLRWSFGQRKK